VGIEEIRVWVLNGISNHEYVKNSRALMLDELLFLPILQDLVRIMKVVVVV